RINVPRPTNKSHAQKNEQARSTDRGGFRGRGRGRGRGFRGRGRAMYRGRGRGGYAPY
ncbi:unnamed protein product, partial [Oikopleura dioica]